MASSSRFLFSVGLFYASGVDVEKVTVLGSCASR